MFTHENGQSLVMWVAVFAVAIAGITMFFVPVKRAITSQVMHTTDHAVWGLWAGGSASDVKQDGGRNWNQIGEVNTQVDQDVLHKIIETPDGGGQVAVESTATSTYTSSYSSY